MTQPSGTEKILQLGRIQRPRGLKGELRVTTSGELLYHTIPTVFTLYHAAGSELGFLTQAKPIRQVTLVAIEEESALLQIVRLKEISDRGQAEELQGLYFGLPLAEALTRFGGGHPPYLFEYIDADVTDVAEPSFTGRVVHVFDRGADFLLEVALPIGNILVPGNSPFIVSFTPGKLVCENLRYLIPD